MVSNSAFIDAVRDHPEYFDLHTDGEIFDLHVSQPTFTPSLFQFGITSGPSWETFETFQLSVPQLGPKRFFRVAPQSEPAGFVSFLAAGNPRRAEESKPSLTAFGATVRTM